MVTQPAGSLADTGTRGAPKFSKFWLGIAYSLYDAGHIKWFLYLSNPYLDGTRVIAHSCTTFPGTHIKTCDQKILQKEKQNNKSLNLSMKEYLKLRLSIMLVFNNHWFPCRFI